MKYYKVVMDKKIGDEDQKSWCGTGGNIFQMIGILISCYRIGFRRFDFTRISK